LVADDPDDARGGAAGVRPVQLGRRRSRLRARRQDQQPGAYRQHPPAARHRPAVLRSARHLRQADRHRQLRLELEHQREGLAHPADAPRAVAHRAGAAPDPRHADLDRTGSRCRLRARLAHRSPGDDRVHGRTVDLDPRLHHRVPVRVRLQARLVPGAGVGRQLLGEPRRLRIAADPHRTRRQHRARPAPLPDVRAGRDQPGLRAHGAREGRLREPRHLGARAAQCFDSDHHLSDGRPSGPAARLVPDRALLLDSGNRPRSPPRSRALRLSGDQGDHRLRGVRHDLHQPARGPDLQGSRPARAVEVTRPMATPSVTLGVPVARTSREVPHTVSPGLWTLAWRRLKSDKVGMVSLVIVILYLVMVVLSALGLIAKDWQKEVGVNYAPPSFLGAEAVVAAPGTTPNAPAAGAAPSAPAYQSTSVDPLAKVMSEIRADQKLAKAEKHETRLATLPFGGDKWGRDVLKKTIKGSETSIFVGLAAAAVATFLGTLFGALAGYYGKWIDDFFNWFYSVFSSIPYLLLILAVAAVLQQKGIFTIVLILGLTGWTGTFRLIRAEYLKHKAREYVQAADAIGASNVRRMFIHIFPNVSHVVLVQMSIYAVG